MSQGPPNPGFMQEKVQKGDFLKMGLRELVFCLFQAPMNLLKAWNAKLDRSGSFFDHLKTCTGSVYTLTFSKYL